jgi:hypothetical protein
MASNSIHTGHMDQMTFSNHYYSDLLLSRQSSTCQALLTARHCIAGQWYYQVIKTMQLFWKAY